MNTSQSAMYVIQRHLIIFSGAHSETFKQDVLYSNLIAQLSANRTDGHSSMTADWYSSYMKVLGTVGWMVSSKRQEQMVRKNPDILRVARDALFGILPNGQPGLLDGAISQLEQDATGSPVLEALRDEIREAGDLKTGDKGTLMFTLIDESAQRASLHLSYEKAQVVDAVNSKDSNAATTLETSLSVMSLSQVQYVNIRESVIKKLGDKIKTYITPVSTTTALPGNTF